MQGLLTPLQPCTGLARALDNKLHKFLICYEKCFLLPKALRHSLQANISGLGEHVLPLAGYVIKNHPPLSFKMIPHLSASTPIILLLPAPVYFKTQGGQVTKTLAWPCVWSFSGLSPGALADDIIGLLAHQPFPSAMPPFLS